MHNWPICLLLIAQGCLATSVDDARHARNNALEVLKSFNPQTIIEHYTTTPKQTNLAPTEGTNTLSAQGFNAVGENQAAQELYQQAQTRPRIKNNPESLENRYAEQLLERADAMLEEDCYKEPAQCNTEWQTTTCEEITTYQSSTCSQHLTVQFKPKTHVIERVFFSGGNAKQVNLDLTQCRQYELCNSLNIINLDQACSKLDVIVTQNGVKLPLLKTPSCQTPILSLLLNPILEPGIHQVTLVIHITQFIPTDVWDKQGCVNLDAQGLCIKTSDNICISSNQSKIIDGVTMHRPCWDMQFQYNCATLAQSTCERLLKQGCSQTNSTCTQKNGAICEISSQTFSCPTTTCLPEKTICPNKLDCTDGACDLSKGEESKDINEGITILGAVTGSAADIAQNQIISKYQASAFAGQVKQCQKYPIGIQDCCRSKGWGDWIVHCPQEMQELLKAKQEKRAVYLGKYQHDLKTNYVYCVFPSKLAGIVQIQGRGTQLHIAFGTAKMPDCRGLAAQELAAINFGALDLSPLIEELRNQITNPNQSSIVLNNQAHIEELNQQERAYG